MKPTTKTRPPAIRLVEEQAQGPDGGPEQRPLPVLVVQPRPEPQTPFRLPPFAPDGAGGYMLTTDVTPEQRREIQSLLLDLNRPKAKSSTTCPDDGTPAGAAKRLAAFRQTLLDMGRREGSGGLNAAGRLLLEHGADARRHLARAWRPDWPHSLARLDGYLERAGVPAADTLPGI